MVGFWANTTPDASIAVASKDQRKIMQTSKTKNNGNRDNGIAKLAVTGMVPDAQSAPSYLSRAIAATSGERRRAAAYETRSWLNRGWPPCYHPRPCPR